MIVDMNIPFEFKLSIFLSLISVLISAILSFVAGNPIYVVLIRMLIFSLIFFVVGLIIAFVLKKYVPEFYSIVENIFSTLGVISERKSATISDSESEKNVSDQVVNANSEQFEAGTVSSNEQLNMKNEDLETFKPLEPENFIQYNTKKDSSLDSSLLNENNKSLGKHIVIDEKVFKYEPKIMAEAIRTMLKRDNEG